MSNDALPAGWSWHPLSDLTANSTYPIGDGDHGAIKPACYQNAGIPYIRVGDIVSDEIVTDGLVYISESVHRANPKSRLVAGDIVIAKTGATIGKVAVIPDTMPEANTTSSIGKVTLDPCNADARYVYRFIQTKAFKTQMWKVSSKTAQPGFNIEHLKQFNIPMPPTIIDQKRISAILDKADAIRRKRQESNHLTEEFLRSVFLDTFGDPVINPKKWDRTPMKNLGNVITGNTPSRERPEYYGNGIEWIKSDNINTPHHFLTKAKEFLTTEGQKIGRSVPEYSTLVTCIAGSPECIGNASLTDRPVSFNQQINAVTPFDHVDPFFLYVHFLVAKKLVQQQSTESMKGMVSKGKFENILFLNPPYELQQNFGKIFKRVKDILAVINSAMTESENLFGSLAQRAFRGEL